MSNSSTSAAPPLVVARSARTTARLTESAVLWEQGATVVSIPYDAIVSASATRGRIWHTLRIGTDAPGTDYPSAFVLHCRRNDAVAFADAVTGQLERIRLDPSVNRTRPPTTQPRERPVRRRLGRGQLAWRGLLALCLVQSLALLCSGEPAAAASTWIGFFLWWACASLASKLPKVVRDCWRTLTRGVRMQAHYVRSRTQHSSSYNPYTHGYSSTSGVVHICEVTDTQGHLQHHSFAPARDSAPPTPHRTVMVVPGADTAETFLSTVLTTLVSVVLLGVIPLLIGAIALVAVPGLLTLLL